VKAPGTLNVVSQVSMAIAVVVVTVTSVVLSVVELTKVEVAVGAVAVTDVVDVETPRQEHADEMREAG